MSLLHLEQVKKSFDQPILDGSLELERGQHVAVTGPSGCGKSTLLHLVSGVLRPDSGRIVLDGQELTQLSETEMDRFRAQHIGYVFQTFHLLKGLTVLENVEAVVTFAGGEDYSRARELLCGLGLEERLDYFPHQLSVGQRQRVAVARAMVNDPPLILADEPTANLDSERAQEVVELLRETCRNSGAALLMVTHDRAVVEAFDSVIDFKAHFGGRA